MRPKAADAATRFSVAGSEHRITSRSLALDNATDGTMTPCDVQRCVDNFVDEERSRILGGWADESLRGQQQEQHRHPLQQENHAGHSDHEQCHVSGDLAV